MADMMKRDLASHYKVTGLLAYFDNNAAGVAGDIRVAHGKLQLDAQSEGRVAMRTFNMPLAGDGGPVSNDLLVISLTATTGAGKTVMAAAVFEALFHGDDNYDIEPDPGAVVIWFSDDPSLNEQSRFRLLEASDMLSISDLVVVQSTFQRAVLEPGKVYFLNTQKLSKSSLLVRGHDPDDAGIEKDGHARAARAERHDRNPRLPRRNLRDTRLARHRHLAADHCAAHRGRYRRAEGVFPGRGQLLRGRSHVLLGLQGRLSGGRRIR